MAGIFSRFFGNSVSVAAGVAIGGSVQNTLNPLTQLLANETWSLHPDVPPDAVLLAIGVAQGQVTEAKARAWAAETGFGDAQMSAMIAVADTGPGVAQAFELWRRDLLSEEGFRRAAKREALEPEWVDALVGLKETLLTSQELANLQQQGFIAPGRADSEGALQGVTSERQQLRFEASGLPPGWAEGLAMLRRNIIDDGRFAEIVREGHTKTKYTPELLALREQVLHATDYAGLYLRGWIGKAERDAGGALTGYSPAQMEQLFQDRGRPATTHQVHIGFARGGRLAGAGNDERATFSKAVKESDIRPEWEEILWAQRYTYPAAFVLRALTEGGDITEAQAHEILLFEGWEPTLAATVSARWAAKAGAAGAADPAVKKAEGNLYTALHKSYVAEESDAAAVGPGLAALKVPATAQAEVLALWNAERALIREQLTRTDIRKLVKAGTWTAAQGVAAIVARGYTNEDATLYLNE